jgi:hypothetical protein
MVMTRNEIKVALEQKYRLMLMMRLEREALESRGIFKLTGESATQRRESLKALAAAFPGALRELDTQSSIALEQRLQALENLPVQGADLPNWARVCWDYHALLKQCLAVKAWLGKNKAKSIELVSIEDAWRAQEANLYCMADWPESYRGAKLLELITHPPGGRLSQLVWEVLEERFEMPTVKLRLLVFGTEHE